MTTQLTVFCEDKVEAAVLDKMLARAATFSPDHPMSMLNRRQMQEVFWDNIEEAIVRHCNDGSTTPIMNVGFAFGAPLDDTVFMATGARPPSQRPQHSFLVLHPPIGGNELMIALYTLVAGPK